MLNIFSHKLKLVRIMFCISALVLFLAASELAYGQAIQTGVIAGKILDKGGEPVSGAKITIISEALSRNSVSTFSGTDGSFRIPGLSPGVYKVSVEADGYFQVGSEFVSLRVATVSEINITIAKGEGETKSRDFVGGPMLTLTAPENGFSIQGSFIKKLPVKNGIINILSKFQGITLLEGQLSATGGSARSNLYSYEGVNITDPFEGSNIINLRFPDISRVSASGAGKSVKNQGTGLSIEIISRADSDRIAANASFNYNSDFLKGNYLGSETGVESELKDFSLQVGGPVGDDRFWVQGSYLRSYFKHTEMLQAYQPSNDSEYTISARGSFFSSNNNRISGIYLGNGFLSKAHFAPDLSTWQVLETNPDAVTNNLDRNTDFFSIKDELQLSDNMRLDTSYSWMSYNKKILPTSGANTLPAIVDPTSRILHQGSFLGEWQKARGERLFFTGNLDFYLDEMAGTHEILLGLEVERDEISVDRGFDGSYKEFYSQGVPLYRKFYSRPNSPPSDVKSELTITRFSIYGQDSWFPRSNISVNFGIIYNGPQVENRYSRVIDWDDISPRISLSWDPFSNGKTILRAGLARYHENALGIAAPQDLYGMSTVFWHQSLVDLGYLNDVKGRKRWRSERDVHLYNGTGDLANRADLETKSPHVDELFVTLEHEPFDDVSVGASFILRRSRDLLEDYEILRSETGIIENPASAYQQETAYDSRGNPYSYFRRLPDAGGHYDQELFWGNDSRLYRDYQALQVFAKTRPVNGLQILANFTLSKSRGNLDVTMEDSSSYSLSQNNPSRFLNADGYLSNDSRHHLNLAAVYFAPYNFTLGMKASFVSGAPYNRYLYNYDLYDLNYSILAGPRGEEYRYDSVFIADFRLEKELLLAQNSFLLTLDIFNLLNDQAVTEVDTRDGDEFGKAIRIVQPRTIQFGISYRF